MRKVLYSFVLIVVLCGMFTAQARDSVSRVDVESIKALERFSETDKKGIFFIDADEVLFTWKVDEKLEGASVVRLYDRLEELFSNLRAKGHKVYIMTYNYQHVIEEKLKDVNLPVDVFDGIIACNMTGDLYTAKGVLFKEFLQDKAYDFTVFIDNFPLFLEDIENVARENNIKLYSFLCTGYKEYYHAYVYFHLKSLQEKLQHNHGDAAKLLDRIEPSLKRYNINVMRFSEDFPSVDTLKEKTPDLIWPYLVYL